MSKPSPGRVALITGGSRGIGRAIAERLASQGVWVVINYRVHLQAAEQVADRIRSAGGEALLAQADVRSDQQVQNMVGRIQEELGRVDILVNNAGITRDGLLVRMSAEDWHDVIGTHLTGAFHCTRAVLRGMMRRRWGRIVNITSVAGMAGNAGQANYAAAKAGLIGFTRSVAREVGSRNITVNAVAPGFIETDMTGDLPEEWKQQVLSITPCGRFGLADEVAAAVAFLVSEEAGYITGQVLSIDGGLGMR